jgi:hypothetical protein
MSPTAPTFGTLNDQLNKAHQRIREFEARETELLAQNRTLRAVITELTHDDHARTAAEPTPASDDGSEGLDIDDHLGKHTNQRLGHKPQSQKHLVNPASAPASATGTTRVKTRRSLMFDPDPIGAIFLIIAVLSLIAAVAYGRDDR